MKYIPLHDPGYKDILSRLFMNLLTISSRPSDDEELSSTYEKILLLSIRDNIQESQISIPTISLAYLNYSLSKNDIKLVRRVYTKFLFNSGYCQSASKCAVDVEIMKNFFDECLLIEKKEMKMKMKENS